MPRKVERTTLNIDRSLKSELVFRIQIICIPKSIITHLNVLPECFITHLSVTDKRAFCETQGFLTVTISFHDYNKLYGQVLGFAGSQLVYVEVCGASPHALYELKCPLW